MITPLFETVDRICLNFPQINEEAFGSIEEFWDTIVFLEGKGKKLQTLREGRKKSYLMYELMRLDDLSLNQKAIETLQLQLKEQENKTFSKIILKTYCMREKLNLYIKNFEIWINPFTFLKTKLKLNV